MAGVHDRPGEGALRVLAGDGAVHLLLLDAVLLQGIAALVLAHGHRVAAPVHPHAAADQVVLDAAAQRADQAQHLLFRKADHVHHDVGLERDQRVGELLLPPVKADDVDPVPLRGLDERLREPAADAVHVEPRAHEHGHEVAAHLAAPADHNRLFHEKLPLCSLCFQKRDPPQSELWEGPLLAELTR